MFQGWSCYFPNEVAGVNVGLACVDGIIALLAFSQSIRIHSRNSQLGWTRQKVFHVLIGSSNVGYFVYFVLTLVATCNGWLCCSYSCGFILMAFPKILSFAAFLLLLSFWIDLCHQCEDEDYEEEEFSFHEALMETRLSDLNSVQSDSVRICLPLRSVRVGSRQKVVILVTFLTFLLTITFAILIWIGMGKNSISSSWMTTVYAEVFSAAMLLLGGALAYYGFLLALKIRRVRYEGATSEMWKVAGLAVTCVLCFTSSAFVAFFSNVAILYDCRQVDENGLYASLLLILFHLIGSSVPSASVLWIMRELPRALVANVQEETIRIAFVRDSSGEEQNPQRWANGASLRNQDGHSDDYRRKIKEHIVTSALQVQISRGSPI